MNIPGIQRLMEVPAAFEQHARRLGFTVEELVWLLAADVCARPPGRIKCVVVPESGEEVANVVPFPPRKPGLRSR